MEKNNAQEKKKLCFDSFFIGALAYAIVHATVKTVLLIIKYSS